jgi:hypothetical protein
MNTKTVVSGLGAFLAATLVTVGTIVGSASAQTSTTTAAPNQPSAQATAKAQATPGSTDAPKDGLPGGGGKRGPGGHGGPDGPGGGGFPGGFDERGPGGKPLTSEGASRQITSTTTLLNLAREDLAYANGKMDTANVSKWLTNAQTLLAQAQTAASASKFGAAGQYAEAAQELVMTAEGQMVQALGADVLPSASRLQGHRGGFRGGPDAANITVSQAQASRALAQTYDNLVAQKAQTTDSAALAYLADAQAAYGSAYTAYGAGKYNEAVASARLAQQLAGVARHVQAAPTAPDNADTVVTVPAPTF